MAREGVLLVGANLPVSCDDLVRGFDANPVVYAPRCIVDYYQLRGSGQLSLPLAYSPSCTTLLADGEDFPRE